LNAKKVFDLAEKLEMPPMDIIDIGGGFTMDGKPG
jgi:diaminopimelate decarboxylase